jgi:hypothetical protein
MAIVGDAGASDIYVLLLRSTELSFVGVGIVLAGLLSQATTSMVFATTIVLVIFVKRRLLSGSKTGKGPGSLRGFRGISQGEDG